MGRARLTDDVDVALDALRSGGLVAIPTETVYGLAADADNEAAVRRVFAAKGRPADHPLIVHVHDAVALPEWAARVPATATVLADACWPGPLTLLVPRSERVLDVVCGGRSSVGVRVPAHPMTTSLLERFGGGLAAPSANRFGHVSPTTAAHVMADLGDVVDVVLDGGPCPIGVESTIVDCTTDPPQVLRPGGIATEDVERLLVGALGAGLAPASGPSRASGMLASHYAPRARVVLVEDGTELPALRLAHPGAPVIDHTADLVRYAQCLYAELRRADEGGADVVLAVLPTAVGLGHAVRDRLSKAAAGR
ncbi:MAG: L-threonylcarbamoyladenylate synthase [Ilumatobacteraceae bacterium]